MNESLNHWNQTQKNWIVENISIIKLFGIYIAPVLYK